VLTSVPALLKPVDRWANAGSGSQPGIKARPEVTAEVWKFLEGDQSLHAVRPSLQISHAVHEGLVKVLRLEETQVGALGVSIRNHDEGTDLLSVLEYNPFRLARFHDDLPHRSAGPNLHTADTCHGCHRFCHLPHAALSDPAVFLLPLGPTANIGDT